MSERGSFVTEYMYCERCFLGVGEALRDWYVSHYDKEVQVVAYRAYAGFATSTYSGGENVTFDCDIRRLIEPRICHPVQVAVMSEAIESREVITYAPLNRDEADKTPQYVDNLARYILASMYGLDDGERTKVIKAITKRYCQHCGTSNEPSTCQCWNDE
jgi:hypothetical protein